jgi:hypothetical protein
MDYSLRGKCKELAELEIQSNPNLKLVRGWYYEPFWNRKEEHWWCEDINGIIHDPSKGQFPSGGIDDFYQKYEGTFECSNCGNEKHEDEMIHEGVYHLCDSYCYGKLVGIL